ncbi:MAG: UPF0236 family transposase-like protein [Bacillota bacterium]
MAYPNAIYQIDRYHLMRDVRQLLSGSSELDEAMRGVKENAPERLLEALRERENGKL